jgi:hypothetical protein
MEDIYMSLRKSLVFSLDVASIASTSAAQPGGYSASLQAASPVLGRCSLDPLSEAEIVGRVHWYATCYPDRVKADMEAIWGESIDRRTAIELYYDFMSFKRGSACEWAPSAGRFYPLFERNPGEVWRAPTDANATCAPIPEGYRFTMTCRIG